MNLSTDRSFVLRVLFVGGVLAASLVIASPAPAQSPHVTTTNAGMDLVIDPKATSPGVTVTIAGAGTLPGARLSIRITPPSGKAVAPIALQADAQGSFSSGFSQTMALGTYAVHVESQDHRLKADGTFLIGAGLAGQQMTHVSQQLFQVCEELLAKITSILSEIPPEELPPGADPQRLPPAITQPVDDLKPTLNGPGDAISIIERGIGKDPTDFGPLSKDPDFRKVDEWNQAGQEMVDRVRKSLGDNPGGGDNRGTSPADGPQQCPESVEKTADKTPQSFWDRAPQSVCDDLHEIGEYFETLESAVTLLGKTSTIELELDTKALELDTKALAAAAKSIELELGTKALAAKSASIAEDHPDTLSQGAATFEGSVADQSMTLGKLQWLKDYRENLEAIEKGKTPGEPSDLRENNDIVVAINKYIYSLAYNHFCASASGPLAASILAVATLNNRVWWKYRVTLKGTLFLTWKAGRSGIAGSFEGKGDVFKLWEDLISVVYPNSVGLYPSLHRCYATSKDYAFGIFFAGALSEGGCLAENHPGWELPSWLVGKPGRISTALTESLSSLGLDFNAFYPDSFKVPVEGDFDKEGNVVLHLEPAVIDFDPVLVRGYVKYVLFLPGPTPVPQLIETALPYKDAHSILARAVGDQSDGACMKTSFKLTTTKSGENLIFSGNFASTHGGPTGERGMEGHADYNMSVRACSPSCAAPY
jgi:hypothetical protein